MGHTETYLPVRDFNMIRIVCRRQDCRAVIELPPSRVEEAMKKYNACCAFCGKPFTMPSAECRRGCRNHAGKSRAGIEHACTKCGSRVPIDALAWLNAASRMETGRRYASKLVIARSQST